MRPIIDAVTQSSVPRLFSVSGGSTKSQKDKYQLIK